MLMLAAVQAEGRPELTSSVQLTEALASPALQLSGALLLLATADGEPLSSTAQAAPKLLPVPTGAPLQQPCLHQ
jgi:hypothetical protein